MSTKPKEGIKAKLKTLFSISRDDHQSTTGSETLSHERISGIHLSPSILRSISPDSELSTRLKALTELENLVSTKLLEDGAVENLWLCIQDLVNSSDQTQRRVGMEFMIALCKGQSSRMGLCRLMFFEHLKSVVNATNNDITETGGESLTLYTELWKSLCRDGEDISDFEEEIGPLCLRFLYEYLRRKENATEFLRLQRNVIKFHAGYFDEEVMRNCVQHVCIIACRTKDGQVGSNDEIVACLNVLDAVLSYGRWPSGNLLVVVTALCKLVNTKSLSEHCWAFMRNLLGSQYGHGTVYTMCSLMQASETYPDEGVLRGAVFFVGTSLWGDQQVAGLRHTPGSVLSSMLRSLDSKSTVVAHELALSIQRLVNQYGTDLQLLTWDLLLQILDRIFAVSEASSLPPASNVTKVVHDTLTAVELLYDDQRFSGSMEQLFNLIENVSKDRPDASILRLMAYRTQSLSPSRGNWLSQLHALLDIYYNRETRSNIRVEAVRILRDLFEEHRHLHGDELVEVVVLPVFADVHREPDYDVQASVISLLLDMARSITQNCFFELLAVLERTLNHRLESLDFRTLNATASLRFFQNIKLALIGLIEIVQSKWSSTPATEALAILDLLTAHLLLQYSRDLCVDLGSTSRYAALQFLLSLGAEIGTQKLVYKDLSTGKLMASAYIICADPEQDPSPPHSPSFAPGTRMTDFSAKDIMKAFAMCVQKDRQWSVVRLLLMELPGFLLSRRLPLSDVASIAAICGSTIRLCGEQKTVLATMQAPDKLTTDDVIQSAFGLLTALIPFRSYFDDAMQRRLAGTIQNGIGNQKSGFAVISTINCLLEMPDIMAPTVKGLVRRLSELPSAPTIAIPVLELLSTLMRMLNLYKDFTPDNFEHVVQTLTSYVNPFMFTDYIVAMAYQVLFRWFLRMPLILRPRIAQFIVKRIASLVSNSSTDENSRRQDDQLLRKAYDDASEVCTTFLAYYTYTDSPPAYDRSPIAQQLFGNNRSRHWIIGDRIFSLTLSGNADGCPICVKKEGNTQKTEEKPMDQDILNRRRRHVSAIQGRVTASVPASNHRAAMDDTCISSTPPMQSTRFGFRLAMQRDNCQTSDDLPACLCWCRDWVELTVRHAVGRQAWVVRSGNSNRSRTSVDIDTLAFMACGDSDDMDDELDLIEDDNESRFENDLVMNLNSELKSTFCVNDDGMVGENSNDGKSVLTISINGGTPLNDRKSSLPRRRPIPTAVNTEFTPDVRSILLQLFSANVGKNIHAVDVNIASLPETEAVERAIKNLDRISPYEAHKIGVIYIGPRQTSEVEILGNQFGSFRYETFLSGLGRLISLKDTDPSKTHVGGLDTNGRDGEFTYHWSDQSSQVIFHIATRMPNKENDPNFQQKKLHIGNDFVAIVFNESGYDYKLSTISGQFARVAIVVQPLDEKILHIKLVAKNEISSWLTMKEAIMSDEQAPLLCRQMAIRADASARIWEQQKSSPTGEPVLSRTAERLRQIKSIKERFGGKPLTVETMFD